MAKTRALIFDLDDTLYSERDYVGSGYRAVAAAFAARVRAPFDLGERMRQLFDTPQRTRVFNVVLAEAAVPPDRADALVDEMIAVYRNHAPAIALLPEARALLVASRRRFKLGLISDGYLVAQRRKVDALDLVNLVDEIILTDAWGREYWKPHPRAFVEMSARLAIPPAACTYVSDNLAKDFVAPNALGWCTVLVARPDRVHTAATAPPGGDAHYVVTSLAELPALPVFAIES